MRVDIVTIFPSFFDVLDLSLLGKARAQGLFELGVHDLRDYTHDRHRTVDDTPYGGGAGMVMKPEPWGEALDVILADSPAVEEGNEPGAEQPLIIFPSPAGHVFTQATARRYANERHIVFGCGRYEGIDQRVFEDAEKRYRVREVSIGDYVLIGGEVAVLVIAEAVTRLIPGVLGNTESHEDDSFSDGLLEGPSYTKPCVWRGL